MLRAIDVQRPAVAYLTHPANLGAIVENSYEGFGQAPSLVLTGDLHVQVGSDHFAIDLPKLLDPQDAFVFEIFPRRRVSIVRYVHGTALRREDHASLR
jgi:hypothetical protein